MNNHAFEQIRAKLVSAPTLLCPDFNVPFILQTDASRFYESSVGIDAIGPRKEVLCYRRSLAVVWAI